MAESSLSLGYADFRREVAYYLGYGRDSSTWSVDASDDLDQIVNSGLRQFYGAQTATGKPHEWSFLSPTTTLAVVGATEDYTMPDSFGGIIGDMTYDPNESHLAVKIVPEQQIRLCRQGTATGRPLYAAIRPKTTDGTTGQRFELLLWPNPDGDYTLSYKSKLLMNALSALNPYPYGGQAMSETILASCLAVAEKRSNDGQTLWQADYQQKLQNAINRDQMGGPEFYPYNGDGNNVGRVARVPYTTYLNVRY